MSLTKCIRKAGKNLSETDASYLKQVRQELIDSGSSAKDAEIGAVKTLIDEWQDSHNALAERISAEGGNVAANKAIKSLISAQEPTNNKKSSAKDKKSSGEPKSKLDKAADAIDSEIDSVAAELAELLKKQGSQLNSGVDPAILALGAKLGALYVSKGVVKFAQYSQAILEKLRELGVDADQVKPVLKEFYAASQAQVSDELFDQMDDMRTVRKFDLDSLGVAPVAVANKQSLEEFIYSNMEQVGDNRALKKLMAEFEGIKPSDVTDAQMKKGQEAMELALVRNARDIVAENKDDFGTFTNLVLAYQNQPNLNVRSSTSMKNQAYSTPAPMAFIASRMAGIDQNSTVYEPTAGNGMLLLAANPETSVANELEDLRVSQLKQLGFQVTQKDATKHSPGKHNYDAAIMNPPFGKLRNADGSMAPVLFDDYTLKSIDHLISAKALEAIKDDGKAVIIIGASKKSGEIGSSDKVFFNWLYSHYNVVDHFEVDGKLYNRQGAAWPIRVITVHGRNETETLSPKSGSIERFDGWGEIYEHFKHGLDSSGQFVGSRAKSVGGARAEVASDELTLDESLSGRQAGRTDAGRGRSVTTDTRDSTGLADRGDVQRRQGSGDSVSDDRQSKRDTEQSGTDATQSNDGRRSDAKKSNTGKPSKRPSGKSVSKSSFQTPYQTRSGGFNDSVLTPNNMAQPLQSAFDVIEKIFGDFDSYVMDRLGYTDIKDLRKAFMGLQVDAVAAAIYNFEAKEKGVIIADQTGVGKGRQAAAIIRYALRKGKTPIFVTVTENLFTDMYEDLEDIGSHNVRPLILNSDSGITRPDGTRLYTNPSSKKHLANLAELVADRALPEDRNALFLTYSQINTPNVQRDLVSALSNNAIFVLDESHNAAGEQESIKKVNGTTRKQRTTGGFVSDVILDKPVVYLSATFAKRPDNMPLYYRTDLMDAVDKPSELVDAIAAGGVPLQSVMSGMLAQSGQLIRRERSFEGISIPVVFDSTNKAKHAGISDQVTAGLRAVTAADTLFHNVFVVAFKEQQKEAGGSATGAGNQASKSIDHSGFNAIIHNYVRQLLLALKADGAAMKAIDAYKENKKPIIALENTMGSFLSDYVEDAGLKVGDVVDVDYRDVMIRALDRTRRISIKDKKGKDETIDIPLSRLDPITRRAYSEAKKLIDSLNLEAFPISPIDLMRHKMAQAGLSVAELTGRELMIDYSGSKPVLARRPKEESNKRSTVDSFNSGTLDALIINKSGSTGLSIHASEKFKDQRPRHMIVAQTMLDVNILVQMLGRINRTGQIELPTYELMGLDIPAEKRPLASSSRKLKSLNANTSANEESDSSLNVPDMYNKYGDQVVARFLSENKEIAKLVNMSLAESDNPEGLAHPNMALKFTGRMALLSVKQQELIYSQIEPTYAEKMEYLTKTGQNDLIASTLDTDAKILSSKIVYEGKKPGTVFGGDTSLHKTSIKLQGNPPTADDVKKELNSQLKRESADAQLDTIIDGRKSGEQAMISLIDERIDKAFQEKIEYNQKADAKPEKSKKLDEKESSLRATAEKYQTHVSRMRGLLRKFGIGSTAQLDIGDDVVTGVVTDVIDRYKGTGDPWASSKTTVRFMVSSGIRSIDIPLANLNMSTGILIKHINNANLESIFDQQIDTNARELRYIATGNLIAGSAKLKGGRMVNFTDDQGKTHQGIMMPKRYGKEGEFDSSDADTNFAIRDAKIATKFLRDNQNKLEFAGGIFSATQSVRISYDNKGWHVQVPKSNKDSDGWKVKFDEKLIKLTGDFYGSGKTMKAYFGEAKLKRVVEQVMSLTSLNALPSMRDAWVKAGGSKKAEASKTFDDQSKFSLGSNDSNATTTNDRPISAVQANKVVDRITASWRGRRKNVVLVDTFDALPDKIKQDAKEQNAEGEVHGVFWQGTVYLVRDMHTSEALLERTMFHEAYGHYGLKELFGKDVLQKMNRLFIAIGGSNGFNALSKKHGIDLTGYAEGMHGTNLSHEMKRAIMTEELLAHIAQSSKSSIKRKALELIGAIRNWLRTKGFAKLTKYNDADLMFLLKQARNAVKRADGKGHHNYVIWDEDAITVEAVNDEKRQANAQGALFSRSSEPTQDDAALEKLGLGPKQAKTLGDKIRAMKDAPIKEALSEKWERAYEGMFDGLYGLKKAEASVGATDVESSGYVGARLASGVADTMHAVLHYGAPVWRDGILQHKEGTQGLLEIFGELNGELNGWLAWMGANRAEELMAQGRENNLTQQDINALKAQAFGREELFEEVRQKYIALNKAMLDMSEEAGLLQSGTRAKWESDYYVPFYRQEDGDADSPILAPRTKRGLSHQAAGIKALKGGDMATNDLLENVLQNWIKLTDSSMKNSALLKAVDNLKGSKYLTDESMRYTKALIPKGSLATMMREDRKYKEMVADYLGEARDTKIDKLINKVAKLDDAGYESMWAVTAPTDPDIIRVQRNGKNEYYRVNDPSLLRAMVHIDAKGADNFAMRSGRYMKKLLTVGVTSSPDFILRNFIRDAVHAWAINPDEFTFGKDSLTGLKHAVKEDEDYRALMFSGASFQGGYVHGTDPDKSAEIVRRALERKGLNKLESQAYMDTLIQSRHKLKNAMLQGWQAYRNAGDKVENSNRLGTYKAAIEAGKSRAQAAFESKDLMDYSLRGNFQLMMTFTDLIPFLNARMQGLSKLGRAAKENPRKVLVTTGGKIALFSMALAWLNDDDERYQELPDWDKDANWHFWLGDDHYRIPKPFEIGIVFGTMPERMVHTLLLGNQENEKLWWSLKHNVLHTLNVNPTPQAVMPIVEVVANRSFFFDTPIEGMSDEGKLDEARYNERTSSTMVELGKVGKWVGLSPKELQHLYNGYLGTMGSYGLMLADMATNKITSRSPRPEWKPEDYPVVKSFYKGSGPAKSTQYMTNVYDRMNEAEEIYRTVRAYRTEGKQEKADDLIKNEREKLRYRKALGLARQQLGSINKQMNRISRDEGMSAAAKRVKMDSLRARKNKIAKRFSELTDGAF